MKYLGKIIDYYNGFSNSITTYVNNKEKTQINISGRLTKRSFIIWLVASLFFILIDVGRCKGSIILTVFFVTLSIIAIVTIIVKSVCLYKELEHDPINIDIYQRELPSKLKPAHVRMLLNDGIIDEISLISTIVDLIDKNYLEIIRENSGNKISRDENFILKKTEKSDEELLEFEKFTIKWLINKYGDGNKVHQNDIKKSLENNIYNERPCDLFEYFQSLVLLSFPVKKYYKKVSNNSKRLVYLGLIFGRIYVF